MSREYFKYNSKRNNFCKYTHFVVHYTNKNSKFVKYCPLLSILSAVTTNATSKFTCKDEAHKINYSFTSSINSFYIVFCIGRNHKIRQNLVKLFRLFAQKHETQ